MVARRKGCKAPKEGKVSVSEVLGIVGVLSRRLLFGGCWAATVRSGCQAAIVQKSGDWLQPASLR